MWIYDYVCAIVHTFAKMCGAFDVILYFVNPTFWLLINLLLILSYLSLTVVEGNCNFDVGYIDLARVNTRPEKLDKDVVESNGQSFNCQLYVCYILNLESHRYRETHRYELSFK